MQHFGGDIAAFHGAIDTGQCFHIQNTQSIAEQNARQERRTSSAGCNSRLQASNAAPYLSSLPPVIIS